MNYVEYFKKELGLVNAYLEQELPSVTQCPPQIHEAMRYAVLGAGKRFRPVLALVAAKACGGNAKSALPAAAALELIHAYSLVHDDLPAMDDDDFRRGKPSCHKKFGEAIGILAGDGLLTLAFEWVGRIKPAEAALKALSELSTAAGTFGMIGGQVADIAVKDRDMAMLDYISIHKTGCLIRAGAVMGALSVSASGSILKSMKKYGECLGLAFQIADDMNDADGYLKLISMGDAEERVRDLIAQAKKAVRGLGKKADGLMFIADDLVARMEQDLL
ncbi:MAG TPA: polyprenyl synthetase family protein [Candidatus Omnitrophota bacterium]|nr:polyprenyl synthetase family protein [Candidatus Omnitrophota bacterium]